MTPVSPFSMKSSRTALPKPPIRLFSSTVMIRLSFRRRAKELCIEGFHEPGVDDPDGDPFGLQEFGGGEGRINAGADRDDGECGVRRIQENLALSYGNGLGFLVQRGADSLSPWVAQGNRTTAGHGGLQQVLEFVFVFRRHDDDVRDGAEEGEVEQAVVGRAVCAHETTPVHRQDDRQFL